MPSNLSLPAASASGARSLSAAAGVALLLGGAALANHLLARRAERRHPPQGRFMKVDGVTLHVLERGEKHGNGPDRPVLLLHGNGAMAEDYAISGVLDRLAARHWVIAFDRPGFGYSERPRSRIWTAEAQAGLIRQALRRLGVRRPIIVAHSWAVLVALAMALEDPEDTCGLVLMAGYAMPTVRPEVPLMAGPAIPVLGDLLRYTVSPLLGWLLAPGFFRKLFAPMPVPPGFRERFPRGMALRPSQLRATAADTALMMPCAAGLAKRYGELATPAIVMSATGDRIVDMNRQGRGLHARLPWSELWLVDGVGHMLHHAVPEDVVAAVTAVAEMGALPRPIPALAAP